MNILPLDERFRRLGGGLLTTHLVTVFGIALSNVFLGILLLFLPWSKPWKTADHRSLRALWVLLLSYLGLYLASAVFSRVPAISLSTFAHEILAIATLPLAVLVVRGEREVRRVVGYLILLGSLCAVYGLLQFLWGFGGIEQRIRGPFSHYMTFAGVLLICDVLLVARLAVAKDWRLRNWLALLLINAGLVGSLTRSAWVALVLVALVSALFLRPRWSFLAWAPILAIVLMLAAPVVVVQRAISVLDLRDTSNYDRLCMAEAGLLMIRDHPALGIGPGLVGLWYPIYRHPTAPRYTVPHLHNSFIQIGASSGLATLAAFLSLLGYSALVSWRGLYREGKIRGERADLYIGALLALAAFVIAGLFEDNWSDTEVQRLLLFVIAMPFCLSQEPSPGD